MFFLPELLTKLKKPGTALADFFKGLGEKIIPFFTRIREHGILKKLFRDRKRFVFISFGVLLTLLLFSIVALLLLMNRNADAGLRAGNAAEGFSRGVSIPPEELFLPAEPDFLPGVILDREPRRSWTAGDAEPYWQDPLKYGEEPWRDRVEAVIDELLEQVP
jgi:hypothetical protein